LRAHKYKIAAAGFAGILMVIISGKYLIRIESIAQLDRQILEWFAACRMDALDRVFAVVTLAGSRFLLLPLILALSGVLIIRKHVRVAVFVAGSFVGASVFNSVVKLFIARPRPDHFTAVIDFPAGFSFPSSHSVQITAFVLAMLFVFKHSLGVRWFLLSTVLGSLLIVLVGLSRLYLQVHYPTDVVAGILLGLFWVSGLAILFLPDHHDVTIHSPGWKFHRGMQP
jgi:membrane-associated phospholipid phosphatase